MAKVTGYSRLQIGMHWLIAALVLSEYATSDGVEHKALAAVADSPLGAAHVYAGAAIAVLMVLRFLLRLVQGAPEPPEDEQEILRKIAVWTHWAFYVLLVIIPVGGLLAVYGGMPGAILLHDAGEPLFFLLFWLHAGAAVLHHFYFKTDVMRRMTRPRA